ncbi:ATP-binding protein [Nitratireductor aestuarii]|uniref:ATP-binding protein n=1 Tax=Nitratireductor aestuarii TaxID=1735103 RepID=A0A916RZW2_9HYPH|nr:TRAP transporter fused permease subunit [Nitratireductor aestuarii]GGA77269.1 ATP-binding protein [Nitratireductor aestuarii]
MTDAAQTLDRRGSLQRAAGTTFAASIAIFGTLWLLGVPFYLGIPIVPQQYLGFVLALALPAALFSSPLRGAAGFAADCAMAVAGAASWLWMSYNLEPWMIDLANRGPEKLIPAVVAILVLCEAVRRSCGGVMAGVCAAFLLYGLFGQHLPGLLAASPTSWPRYFTYLYFDSNAVPGLILNVGATDILGFIIFGATLGVIGGTAVLTDIALATMGHLRGGSAKAAIVASSLFGTLSGSTVANVMSTGVVTIPLMKRGGYSPAYAGGVEAVASNGGQITPPVMGATAFVIAETLQIPYSEVVVVAVIPALIYYVALFIQVHQYAKINDLKGAPRDELPRVGPTLLRGWPMLVPLPVLMYYLFYIGASPGRSAIYATAVGVICDIVVKAVRREKPELMRLLVGIPVDAGKTLLQLLLVCAAAGIVIGTVNLTGVAFTLTLQLSHIGEIAGIWPLLFVTAGIALVLGLGMPTVGVYIILSVLLAPAMIRLGIEPISAHFFVFYFGLLSMLIPPVAIASFAAAALAGSSLWSTSVAALRLAMPAYVMPFVFVLNPSILTHESWTGIVTAFVTIIFGPLVMGMPFAFGNHTIWWKLRYPLAVVGVAISLSTAFEGGGVGPLSMLAIVVSIGLFATMTIHAGKPGTGRRAAAAPLKPQTDYSHG